MLVVSPIMIISDHLYKPYITMIFHSHVGENWRVCHDHPDGRPLVNPVFHEMTHMIVFPMNKSLKIPILADEIPSKSPENHL